MGFSASATYVIFSIALIAAGGSLLVAVFNAQDDIDDAWRADWERRDGAVHTSIDISSATHDSGANTFTIRVNNTGGTTLVPSRVEVIVDGSYMTASISTREVEGTTSEVWSPGDELIIVVASVTSAPAYAALVTGNGVSDYWRA